MLAPVGRGEFSTVWKVREKSSGDIFAVKRGKAFSGAKDRWVWRMRGRSMPTTDPPSQLYLSRQRQLQEVDILQTLNSHPHSHVVEFHEAWEQNQQLHIRTAFADCGDLATYLLSIADAGGLDEIRCWKVLTEMTCVSSPLSLRRITPIHSVPPSRAFAISTTSVSSTSTSNHPTS